MTPAENPPRQPLVGAEIDRLRSLTCAKWNWHDEDVIPAWVADMDLPPVPAAVDAVRALVERGDFGYNMAAEFKLPEAFAEWQQTNHGWCPDTERVRVFCDVMQVVTITVWLQTKPGDGIVVFTPVYPPFLGTVEKTGRRIVECPLGADNGWALDPERLSAAVDETTTAILLCNPHNPTGRAFTRDELTAIADVAERHDLLVISDEIWADLRHGDVVHTPMALLGDEIAARTLTINAASKSFNLAGLRTAVAHIGHAGLAEAIAAVPSHVFGAVGSPGAEASLAAWTQGAPWLAQTRAHLTAQRDHLAARLAAELPEVGFTVPEATYLAWLDFRALELGDDPAKRLLETARVALSSGLDFGHRGTGFARLNFATTQQILDEILDRIIEAVR
ncbi:MAG: PatB family C-S lyase [Coriobacteriia bacterium]|nr:PatB family C-S lyase [Coriobacteriia bacterium]